MRLEEDFKLDFKDVLIKPKRSTLKSRSEVSLERSFNFKHSGWTYTGIPIIAANMDTVGTFNMAKALGNLGLATALHKHYNVHDLVDFFTLNTDLVLNNVFYSMGITETDEEKFRYTGADSWPINVCIDVANGYSEPFLEFVKKFREKNPNKTIMAGNVVTAEMTEALILAGADIVKVGIGPGSVCTTRKQTGVGYPQLSAIIECADAAHGLDGHICADGGCTVPGDVAKAFGGGADFVMLGGMLSGHAECDGDLVSFQQNKKDGDEIDLEAVDSWTDVYMRFYGMSSTEAMEKHSGGVAEYRASEGKAVLVPYKGSVENTVKEILGGVRSTCTYTGASKLKELSKRTTFIRVTQQKNDIFGTE